MTNAAILRALLLSMLLLSGAIACRDVGIVGEGGACPEGCAANERCVSGACVPRNDGVAGDGSNDDDDDSDDTNDDDSSDDMPSEDEEE